MVTRRAPDSVRRCTESLGPHHATNCPPGASEVRRARNRVALRSRLGYSARPSHCTPHWFGSLAGHSRAVDRGLYPRGRSSMGSARRHVLATVAALAPTEGECVHGRSRRVPIRLHADRAVSRPKRGSPHARRNGLDRGIEPLLGVKKGLESPRPFAPPLVAGRGPAPESAASGFVCPGNARRR